MKRYFDSCTESTYLVGEATEIKALYKSITRAAKNGNTGLCPRFLDFPVFNENRRIYALCVDFAGYVTVINSDTMLSLILSGDVSEEE